MKRKKIALYDPYLDILGGGEKHILSILKVFEEQGYEVSIFWDKDLTDEFKKILNISFTNKINFHPNLKKISTLEKIHLLSSFDVFLYISDGSYILSPADKTYVFSMVPSHAYFSQSFFNKVKLRSTRFIVNSAFTQKFLQKQRIPSDIVYPFIEDAYVSIDVTNLTKEPVILSVGRFFKHLHSKRQDVAIQLFKRLKEQNSSFKPYKLILAGGVLDEDKGYIDELNRLIGVDPSIEIKTNISHQEIIELYKRSQFYWHLTGFGMDEDTHPEQVEHLGITPIEAMAAGCIVFAYGAGGPKELIQHGETGFLFNNEETLFTEMKNILEQKDMHDLQVQAKAFVKSTFSYETFKKRVIEIFNLS